MSQGISKLCMRPFLYGNLELHTELLTVTRLSKLSHRIFAL